MPASLLPRLRAVALHWPLVPVLALASFLRLYRLSEGIYYGDEAEYAAVMRSLATDWRALEYPDVEGLGPAPFVSQPPALLYAGAVSIHLAGAHLGPMFASAIAGILTVAVVYLLGLRFGGRVTATLAALFLAVLPYHVGLSRGAQLDAGFTFAVALAVWAGFRYLERPSVRTACVVGVCVAFAALAKLPGLLVVAILSAGVGANLLRAWWLRHEQANRQAERAPPESSLTDPALHAGVAGGIVLLAIAGYLLLLAHLHATKDLMVKLGWQAGRVIGSVPTPGSFDRPWTWYFTDPVVGLPMQLGLVLCAVAAAGAVVTARKLLPDGRAVLLLAWPLVILGFFFASQRKEWFYLAPALPAFALWSAVAVEEVRKSITPSLQGAGSGAGTRLSPDQTPSSTPARVHSSRARPTTAVAWTLVALVAVSAILAPVGAAWGERIQKGNRYGQGVPEAADWLDRNDPDAQVVATLLGRYAIHLRHGQPAWHYFSNHTFVDDAITQGSVRYLVDDPYLQVPEERAWFAELVARHGGTVVQEYEGGYGTPVRIIRFGTGGA